MKTWKAAHAPWLLLCLAVALPGCDLFKTSDDEDSLGRGVRAFDPYQGAQSGATRLALYEFHGCSLLPGGRVVGNTNPNIPYPECRFKPGAFPGTYMADPTAPLPTGKQELIAGTTYFLNQLTLLRSAWDEHKNPAKLSEVTSWMQAQAPFHKLDWRNLSELTDEIHPSQYSVGPHAFRRRVTWGNANWMLDLDEQFTVEVLDADGQVRASQVYDRRDFMISGPGVFHTALFWEVENMAPVTLANLNVANPAPPPPPGFISLPLSFNTHFKIELVGSTEPNKSFDIPEDLSGDGAIRVTWSKLPDDPFHFPVTYISEAEVPPTCFKADDPAEQVPCTFGLNPEVIFSPPANGEYFVGGETVQVQFRIKDGAGNLLHPPDLLPSPVESEQGKANGLLYMSANAGIQLNDPDTIAGFTASGPKHEMKTNYELNGADYWKMETTQMIPGVGNSGLHVLGGGAPVLLGMFPGAWETKMPAIWQFRLPENAKPGTYTFWLKTHRAFHGERMSKMAVVDFPVGQVEPTTYPNQIGNCQICHRGVQSLENLRHGTSVNNIEGCKTCHDRDAFVFNTLEFQALIHRVHMNSPLYPQKRNDCSVCHLTQASAVRPSLVVCGSCHPAVHGNEYFDQELANRYDPAERNTVFSNCAAACHTNTTPTQHILPQQ